MTKYHWDSVLDSTGLLCPLPVLRVIADDPAAIIDIPHYCHESGNKILKQDVGEDGQIYLLMKM